MKHDMIARKRGPHAADIIAITIAQVDMNGFRQSFENQFNSDLALGERVLRISDGYFRTCTSPGLLLYEEHVTGDKPLDRVTRGEVSAEIARAHRVMLGLLPPTTFFQLSQESRILATWNGAQGWWRSFLSNLDVSGISIYSHNAQEFIPTVAFSGAFSRGDKFVVSTGELLGQLSTGELALARHHLIACAERLAKNEELTKRYVRALRRAGP
jgi:hypothetical protein